MKHVSTLILVCLGFIMQAQQLTQTFNYSQNELVLSQNNNYDIINYTEAMHLEGDEFAGQPQLPVLSVSVLLPQGATATTISISIQQEIQLAGTFNIYPAQPPAYPNFEVSPAFVAQDPAIYTINTPFPQEPLLEYTNHRFRDYNYVSISFIPFKYLPQNQQLFLLNQISITINYAVNNNTQAHKLRPYNATDALAYTNIKQSTSNGSIIDSFYPEAISKINGYKSQNTIQGAAFATSAMPSLEGSEVHYVIITNNTDISGNIVGDGDFTAKFQEYANWKTQSGTPAKVITVDDIKTQYTGVDTEEKIRNFIQDAHLYWGTEYVLLGGGASIIPVRWIYGNYLPTDLYYAAIYPYEDNWNANGDYYFGGGGDNSDWVPDIAVGRAPVDTNEEVDTFLKKNFTYARFTSLATIPPQTDWLDRELMGYGAAFNRNWDLSCALRIGYEIIQDHDEHTNIYGMFEYFEDRNLPYGYDETWCLAYYPEESDCTENNIPIMDAPDLEHDDFLLKINEGYNIINVLEHGGPYGLGLGAVTNDTPRLTPQDFQNLTDTGKYGIFLAGGCHSAAIERDYYIGEQWVNAPGGGVSYFGNSYDIDATTSYSFNKQFYNSLYIDNDYKQGFLRNFAAMNTGNNSIANLKMNQLLGDPDLSIYTEIPTFFTVSHPNSITNGNQDIIIDVTGFPDSEIVKMRYNRQKVG